MSVYRGDHLTVAIFGQSHAAAIGVTIDGLPAGERVDLEALEGFLRRRAPGHSDTSTPRREGDVPKILCGLVDGVTCGAPLTAIIENTNIRSGDYDGLRDVPRPGHADYTAYVKYKNFQDAAGGGAFSGRLTAPLCIAGGIALQMLERRGVRIAAHIRGVGEAEDRPFDPLGETPETLEAVKAAPFPVLDEKAGEEMRQLILKAKAEGDSVGGVVECIAQNLPAGLGGPLFDGLESRLALALFGVPAVKGVEFGAGFQAARLRGSQNNDPYTVQDGKIVTTANRSGGVLGGISSGMPLVLRAAFKPTPSIPREQDSVSLSRMEPVKLAVKGRHDPCVVPRAVPVVEAAAAMVLLDAMLGAPAVWEN